MSSYYNVYNAVKPFAKMAGQKTVAGVKAAAKKAKMAIEKFDIDQKYKKTKDKVK